MTEADSTFYLQSKLLTQDSVVAGFSTRFGGDDMQSLARAAGFSPTRFFGVTQVHGRDVVVVTGSDTPENIESRQADALVTNIPGTTIAIRTADCVPILLSVDDGRAVAAAHGGWRGLVAGVIPATIAELDALVGAKPVELRAAIGPAIDPCCFEVGEDVAESIAAGLGTDEVILRGAARRRPHGDLRAAALRSLLEAGVPRTQIELVGPCTRCAASMFHSYRREGPGKGRQFSFVYVA